MEIMRKVVGTVQFLGDNDHDLRYSSTTSAITFQQFVNVMSGKPTQSFTCAVHWRDRQVSSKQ